MHSGIDTSVDNIAGFHHIVYVKTLSAIHYVFAYDGRRSARTTVSREKEKDVVNFSLGEKVVMSAWREPPHVALANMRGKSLQDGSPKSSAILAPPDLKALAQFMEKFGPAMPPTWGDRAGNFEQDPKAVAEMQFVLRSAWFGDVKAINLIADGEQESGDFRKYINAQAKAQRIDWVGGIYSVGFDPGRCPVVETKLQLDGMVHKFKDLWSLIRWRFLFDYWADHTRICRNENCFAPYFVMRRKGQTYCSHDCALAAASRNYRRNVRKVIARERANGKWPPRQV